MVTMFKLPVSGKCCVLYSSLYHGFSLRCTDYTYALNCYSSILRFPKDYSISIIIKWYTWTSSPPMSWSGISHRLLTLIKSEYTRQAMSGSSSLTTVSVNCPPGRLLELAGTLWAHQDSWPLSCLITQDKRCLLRRCATYAKCGLIHSW